MTDQTLQRPHYGTVFKAPANSGRVAVYHTTNGRELKPDQLREFIDTQERSRQEQYGTD